MNTMKSSHHSRALTPSEKSARKTQYTGFGLAFMAAILFSSKTIFIKLAYQYGVDTISFLTLRMLFAAPFYVAVLIYLSNKAQLKALTGHQHGQILILGFLSYYLASVLDLEGLHYISANLERMILYLYPTMTVIIGAVFLKRTVKPIQLAAITGAYIGIGIVFFEDFSLAKTAESVSFLGMSLSPVVFGSLCVLGSALSYALFVAFSESAIKTIGAKQFTAQAMLASSAGIGLHFLIAGDLNATQLMALPTPVFHHALSVAFICTVLPSFMLAAGIAKIGANNAGVVGMSGPVITLIAAAIVLAEPVTSLHIVGGAIILTAIFVLGRSKQH